MRRKVANAGALFLGRGAKCSEIQSRILGRGKRVHEITSPAEADLSPVVDIYGEVLGEYHLRVVAFQELVDDGL